MSCLGDAPAPRTPQTRRSPEWVQMSTAAAITLGLVSGRMHRCRCTRCLNLLLTYPAGCRANCAYCGLARHRDPDAHPRRIGAIRPVPVLERASFDTRLPWPEDAPEGLDDGSLVAGPVGTDDDLRVAARTAALARGRCGRERHGFEEHTGGRGAAVTIHSPFAALQGSPDFPAHDRRGRNDRGKVGESLGRTTRLRGPARSAATR